MKWTGIQLYLKTFHQSTTSKLEIHVKQVFIFHLILVGNSIQLDIVRYEVGWGGEKDCLRRGGIHTQSAMLNINMTLG